MIIAISTGFGIQNEIKSKFSDVFGDLSIDRYDNDLYNWINKLNQIPSRHSGFVDRFYFHSLYTRLYPGILFEFATLGPGFIDDEECESELGTKLSLPPFLRPYRSKIENNLKPLQLKEDE